MDTRLEGLNCALHPVLRDLFWIPDAPYAFFGREGHAPDPYAFGYSRPWGEGLGLPRHRQIESVHAAVFWTSHTDRALGMQAWIAPASLSSPSAHHQLRHQATERALERAVAAFQKAVMALDDLHTFLQHPTANLALAVPPPCSVNRIGFRLYTRANGQRIERHHPGLQRPHILTDQAA